MKKKITKPKKFAYIQDWGTYSNQTLVVVGGNHAGILKIMKSKKLKIKPEAIKQFGAMSEEDQQVYTNGSNGAMWHEDGRTILWFKDWKNDWLHWDTLLHECLHLIQAVMYKEKRMTGDYEATAYQLEYLFREIRRKLWKAYSK